MKIITWGPSADGPPSQAWLARYLDGKRFLPALISGSTEDAVKTKAQEFWDAETTRFAKREGRKPETVADTLVERVGAADPVVEGVAHLTAAERAWGEDVAVDFMMTAMERVVASADPDGERDIIREELGLPTLGDLDDLLA